MALALYWGDGLRRMNMSMTRRELLESSMWATASAAAVSLTPRPLAAAPKLGANEVLRIAVVGLRGRGGSHLAEFGGMKDVQVAAIVDIDDNSFEPAIKT